MRRPGPFRIEAAIQLAHASRQRTGLTPWADIRSLDEGLVALHPTIGARIGHALAVASADDDPRSGLALPQAFDPKRRPQHQAWWAVQSHGLDRAGAVHTGLAAHERALTLTHSPALRATLASRQRALAGASH